MRKKVFKYTIGIALGVICLGFMLSCVNNGSNPAEILKQRIDKAEMVVYVDSIYGARLFYPEFFHVDSIGKYYVQFSYSDENVKELCLEYDIIPPRLFDSSEEAVRILSNDSLTTASKVKKGSFVITQEYECFPRLKCIMKHYKTIHGWARYSLTYEKQYEDAVERLTKMVVDWKIYDEDIPKCFTDVCDFLDI